jgi:hypothetical protein
MKVFFFFNHQKHFKNHYWLPAIQIKINKINKNKTHGAGTVSLASLCPKQLTSA